VTGTSRGLSLGAGEPVDDVSPARRGQRPADVLDRERGAQVGEREPLAQWPIAQGAEYEGGSEDVAGSGGIVGVDREGGDPLLFTGDGIDGHRTLTAARHHRDGNPRSQRVQGVVRIVGMGVGHRLDAVGQESVEVLQLLQDARRPFLVLVPSRVREQQHPGGDRGLEPLARLGVQMREADPGGWHDREQFAARYGRRVHVGHQGPVSFDHHGDRHR
jgi:hypothetical protein